MDIEYVTHASLFLKTKGTTLLTDPFFFLDDLTASFLLHFPDRPLKADHFGRIDYLYCSHIHDDHCHKETLLELRDRIGTIILPANQPFLERKIRSYGFDQFLFLPDQSTITLPSGIRLTNYADPNDTDHALVIESEGVAILHENDCLLNPEIFEKMADRFRIDYAFFPHTGAQDIFPLLLSRPKEVLERLSRDRERVTVRYHINNLRILKPRVVIPYAYTIAYYNEDQLDLNQYNRTTPTEFKRYLASGLPETECWTLQPGDIVHTESGKVTHYRSENLWGESVSEYEANLERYLDRAGLRNRKLDFGEADSLEPKLYEFFKSRAVLPYNFRNHTIALRVVGAHSEKVYYVDTERKTLSEAKPADKEPIFDIIGPASIFEAFLAKKYDSFMILYSYRITLRFNVDVAMTEREECYFFVQAIMALFDYELYEREFLAKT